MRPRKILCYRTSLPLRAGVAAMLIVSLVACCLADPCLAQVNTNLHFNLLPEFPVSVNTDTSMIGLQAFTLADVNNDHILDLIVIDQVNDMVNVSLGNGAGTFASSQAFPVFTDSGDMPTAVAVADVSSPFASPSAGQPDGNPDIIVGSDGGDVWILLGDGTGAFPEFTDITDVASADGVVGFALGDFDGNSFTDIALGDDLDTVYFLCNTNGNFATCDPNTDSIDTGGVTMIDIVAGDFNGDGKLDVATLNQGSGDVSPIFNTGGGTFDDAVSPVSALGEGVMPSAFAVGKVDSDGNDDVVVVNFADNGNFFGVPLYGVSSGGGRLRADPNKEFNMEFHTTGLALDDFDNDGSLDVLAPTNDNEALDINLGDGNGGFSQTAFTPGGIRQFKPGALVITGADVGGDTLPDFVVLQSDGMSMRVGINDTLTRPTNTPTTPTATLSPTPTITGSIPPTNTVTPTVPTPTATATTPPTPIPTANYGLCDVQVGGQRLAGIATGKLDGDGTPDIAVTDAANNMVYVIFNTAQLQSQLKTCAMAMSTVPVQGSASAIPVGPTPGAIVASDIDRDGKVDLVVAVSGGIVILHNNGQGQFTADAPIAVGTQPVAIVADYPIDPQDPSQRMPLDLNRDGHTDLVIADAASSSLFILYGNANGGFGAPVARSITGPAITVTAADFNQDGKVDLAAGTGSEVVLLLQQGALDGNGQANFQSSTFSVNDTIVNVASGYFNADVMPDLLVTLGSVADVYVFQNSQFTLAGGFGAGAGPSTSAAGATAAGIGLFNSDGSIDAVVANFRDSDLHFGMGDGTGSFKTQTIDPFGLGGQPVALSVANIDSDGMLDVITANNNGTISVLLSSVPPATPTPLPTSTVTATGTPTQTGMSTATPSVTPATPVSTVTATPTKAGDFALGGGCSIDDTSGHPSLGAAATLGLLLLLRRVRGRRVRTLVLLLAGSLAVVGTASAQTLPSYVECKVSSANLGGAGSLLGGAVGDFDGKGSPDLALVDRGNNQMVIALTNQDLFKRGSCPEAVTALMFTVMSPVAVASGFINTDNSPDLAVAQNSPQQVQVFTNAGGGSFTGGTTALPLTAAPVDVSVSDLDGDGQRDLIAGDGTNVTLQFGSTSPPATPTPAPTLALGSDEVVAVRVANFDDNPLLDIAAVDLLGQVYLFLQTQARTFAAPITFNIGASPVDMQVGDFDGNGVPDLAFITTNGQLLVFLGQRSAGTVSFDGAQPPPVTIGGTPSALALSDLNGDGQLDAVVADKSRNVHFFLGTGGGTLVEKTNNARQPSAVPNAILLADLDADGLDDVITTNSDGSLTIFLSSDPPPTPRPTSTATPLPSATPADTDTPTPTATPTATSTQPTPTPVDTTTPGQFEVMGQGCANVGGGSGPADAMPLLVFAALVFLRRRAR